jgi:thiamine-phosphate pyrophosphorylase
MDTTATYDACHTSLISCLRMVAEGCPDLSVDSPPLRRLRNLVQVLPTARAVRVIPKSPDLTLSQTLGLLSTSQETMAMLRSADTSGRVYEEMDQALSQTIATLREAVGKALRRKRVHRVRGLYVIIDPQVANGRDPLELAASAVRGGARMLQLRDKLGDKGTVLPLATRLQQLCRDNDVDLIINDHADLATVVGSAGLHLGQTDFPVAQARRVLSPEQVLGRSNHEIDELVQSQKMGADHVAFGAIYATGTKGVGRPPQGVARLRDARGATQLPLVAIGGINAENVGPVVEAGADAICVTAAVGLAENPEAAASRLVEAIRDAGGRV